MAPDNLVVAPDGGAAPVTVPTDDRTRVRGLGNGLTGLQPGQRVIVRIGGDRKAVAVLSPPARAVGTVTGLNGDRAVLVRPDGLTEPVDLAAANPKPVDGDLVAVHRTPEVRSRQIVVARLDNEVTVKRYKQDGKVVWLLPENEEFEPIRVDLKEQSLIIEGVVVGVLRQGKSKGLFQ